MSKKKCPYWAISPTVTGRPNAYCGICCPKNTNDRCEIIPKKPRMVRVKAWFIIDNGGIEVYQGKWDKNTLGTKPCTILIDKKYLRRKP